MKKTIFIFCLAFSLFATCSFAQEVHGIETKKVCFEECNPDGTLSYWSDRGSHFYPWYAFRFTNMNTCTASIEVELYEIERDKYNDKLVDTKSFVLKPNESYDWKPFNGSGCRIYSVDYYVKYKAYKLQ